MGLGLQKKHARVQEDPSLRHGKRFYSYVSLTCTIPSFSTSSWKLSVEQRFRDHSDPSCIACPHDYKPKPTEAQPRRCVLPETDLELEGVPCGEDTGLGSVWEANLRMPALARFPGRIPVNSVSKDLISTLDVIPSFLSLISKPIPKNLDGMDMSETLIGKSANLPSIRVLFFWRDGFASGPLPPPYGRFDVAAVSGQYVAANKAVSTSSLCSLFR